MNDDRAREQRIDALEQELRALRASSDETRRPRARSLIVAFAVVAASLPIATWLHFEDRDERARKVAKTEYRYARKLQLAKHRQERHLEYIEAALSPEVGEAARTSALRYLADPDAPGVMTRKWALAELPEIERGLAVLRERLKTERTRLGELQASRDTLVERLVEAQRGQADAVELALVDSLDREIAALRDECARLERRIGSLGPAVAD